MSINKPSISFVITVFNENYRKLERCIDSIMSLITTKKGNFEVIIIDDGSNFKNSEKYDYLAHKKNIYYFRKTNGGVSSARNFGIKKARGKYIFFVDSDDELYGKFPSEKKFIECNADIIIFDVIVEYERIGKKSYISLPLDLKYYSGTSLLYLTLKNGLLNWVCGKLFKKSFLEKNFSKFNTNLYNGEDIDFVINLLQKNPSIYYPGIASYIYHLDYLSSRERIIHDPKRIFENTMYIYHLRLRILAIYSNKSFIKKLKLQIYENLLDELFSIYTILTCKKNEDFNKITQRIHKIIVKDDFKEQFRYFDFSRKIKFKLINLNFTFLFYIVNAFLLSKYKVK